MEKKSFLIKDLGKDVHFQLKRYALYNNKTMETVGIEGIKEKIGYQEPKEEAQS